MDCLYASASWGLHDARWFDALERTGFRATAVVLGRDAPDAEALRRLVGSVAGDGRPVLAGPLDTITAELIDLPVALVGLSWGYDLHRLQAAADLAWLPRLKGLVVDSSATRNIAVSAGLAPERITTLPWGTDLDIFTPTGSATALSELGVPDGARFVLSLRAHEPLYRVADVIAAFALVAAKGDDVHLVIGHEGTLTAALRAQAADLGLAQRIHFIGRLDEQRLPPLLRAASAYVTASEVDGTSVTLLQAMACGVPVVASDNPGNRDWIAPGITGQTFAISDTDDLAKALDRALVAGRGPVTAAAQRLVVEKADWARNISRLRDAMGAVPLSEGE